ncbi:MULTISPECIES: hypothetical protein [Mycobacteroides]|nr:MULTISPECIES: hypothetical protein [Mycobacteroides]MBV6360520.1 hypothetical protein [Mycobacteroides chelonae]SHW95403.1 Uncharacterised protein [Mycobacteroides abscessus subsp. abscessus]SKL77436.1 Uncharacterised protein [Mycobacteroides abscessus subsp. abscessus]SKM55327.1 Uncharacterised protein [Mycobacteroides abscessus subsp. abscessus]SLK36110.1 Uncharacterised protein [Mycobacteroides abscessus subsp. abscessus]
MNHWDEDPDYPLKDWKREVKKDKTRLGYWDWTEHRMEIAGDLDDDDIG